MTLWHGGASCSQLSIDPKHKQTIDAAITEPRDELNELLPVEPNNKRKTTEPSSKLGDGLSLLERFIVDIHDKIPVRARMQWTANLKETIDVIAPAGLMTTGSGCSGTDIYRHGLEKLCDHWGTELDIVVSKVVTALAAEKDEGKRDFLDTQHPIELLLTNTELFHHIKAPDSRSGKIAILPRVDPFHMGFSCTGLTRISTKRVENKGCVRAGEKQTGMTFSDAFKYIERFRPRLSFLENVQEIENLYASEDGAFKSDKDFVITKFEEISFTVIYVRVSAKDKGSPMELKRGWFIIWDIPPTIANTIGLEAQFFRVFNELNLPQYDHEDFFLNEQVCNFPPKGKSNKEAPNWKCTHEEFYLRNELQWPPPIDLIDGFGERETELIHLANHVFPSSGRIPYEYFDANLSAEWTFGLAKKGGFSQNPASQILKDPWKDTIPTWTGKSQMCVREVVTSPTSSSQSQEKPMVTFRRIHPLEGFQLNLWDVGLFSLTDFSGPGMAVELLNDMVGNSWSLFHYVPIVISAFGAVSWNQAAALIAAAADAEAAECDEDIEVDSSDSVASG